MFWRQQKTYSLGLLYGYLPFALMEKLRAAANCLTASACKSILDIFWQYRWGLKVLKSISKSRWKVYGYSSPHPKKGCWQEVQDTVIVPFVRRVIGMCWQPLPELGRLWFKCVPTRFLARVSFASGNTEKSSSLWILICSWDLKPVVKKMKTIGLQCEFNYVSLI